MTYIKRKMNKYTNMNKIDKQKLFQTKRDIDTTQKLVISIEYHDQSRSCFNLLNVNQ